MVAAFGVIEHPKNSEVGRNVSFPQTKDALMKEWNQERVEPVQ